MRILLIDDDLDTGGLTDSTLRREAYAVDWVRSRQNATLALRTQTYDVILLDLKLPDGNGLTLLRHYRGTGGKVPVLIVTAAASIAERVHALDAGADDFLLKPFAFDEMLARVRALLRRPAGQAQTWIDHAHLRVNLASHQVTLQGAPVHLTLREFAILRTLLGSAGKVMPTEQIETRVYGWGEEVESNAIHVYIHHLRKKLGAGLIKNVRGAGYMIAATF